MIGDSAHADIGGANKAAISSVWLHRGRSWSEDQYHPTLIADNCIDAIDYVTRTGLSSFRAAN